MGASIDNNKAIMYVPSNNMARITWTEKVNKKYQYYDYNLCLHLFSDIQLKEYAHIDIQ